MKGSGIHIKPSHEGIFKRAAARHKMGTQEYAQKELSSPHASPEKKKQANFARMAKRGWKPL
jgi:hypothetical protein